MILIHLFNNFDLFLHYRTKFWIKFEIKVSHSLSKVVKKYIIHINLESHKEKTNETSKTQSEKAQLEEKTSRKWSDPIECIQFQKTNWGKNF